MNTPPNEVSLDHISISQKTTARCVYGAPYLAVVSEGKGTISQACCNHWDCPKCRFTLYGYHQHRMIEGAKILIEKQPLYFVTLTCRGKDLSVQEADDNYLLWTNRLLSTCRARCKKQGQLWRYVQVTERQQRGHAHSHLITTFCPDDVQPAIDDKGKPYLFSDWFRQANIRAGLGEQCRITGIESAVGVGSYIAKYLKKQLSTDVWPKHWKRIRYSHGWPDNAAKPDWARSLVRRADWEAADALGIWFETDDWITHGVAKHHMRLVRLVDTMPSS